MDVEMNERGEDVPECSPLQKSTPPPPPPLSPPPSPLPPARSPWHRRCRTKLFLSFTSTAALLTALIYFGAESKVVVAAFDATLKQFVSGVGNTTFETWTHNLTEVLTSAVRSASFGSYVVNSSPMSNSGQPDDG